MTLLVRFSLHWFFVVRKASIRRHAQAYMPLHQLIFNTGLPLFAWSVTILNFSVRIRHTSLRQNVQRNCIVVNRFVTMNSMLEASGETVLRIWLNACSKSPLFS